MTHVPRDPDDLVNVSVPTPKLALKKAQATFPPPQDASASAGLEICPHCARPAIVRSALRCSFCGEALQAGAMSWSAVERENAARQAREQAAPEIVPPDIGLDAEGRASLLAQLRQSLQWSPEHVAGIDLFLRGMIADFPPEQAQLSRLCPCGQPGQVVVTVHWQGRASCGSKLDPVRAVRLRCGIPSKTRPWSEFSGATHHAACPECARQKGWRDRYERFFGKVPGVLRVGKVERHPLLPLTGAAATRGDDLRYDVIITPDEETNGFTRTLTFERQTEVTAEGVTITSATENIVLAPAWTVGHVRRADADFHYALRLRGRGSCGFPAGNNGDLFVTVTVQD